MDYQVIIISQNDYQLSEELNYTTLDHCILEDENSLIYDDQKYYFDYLITDDDSLISNLKLEKEHNIIITNYYQETSALNVFAIGKLIKTNRTIEEQLEIITNYIINGE